GTTATLRWKDPNGMQFPYVVQVVGSQSVHQTDTSTQSVIAGLLATKGYCFAVGAVYAIGSVAYAAPVCIRGATATSTTTSTPGASAPGVPAPAR
ncbi:MAG: hypothetical protein M3137_06405, partial [Actinomycetota bacterium]|nr:hypothetical protein [Actinomycetota bacterium]